MKPLKQKQLEIVCALVRLCECTVLCQFVCQENETKRIRSSPRGHNTAHLYWEKWGDTAGSPPVTNNVGQRRADLSKQGEMVIQDYTSLCILGKTTEEQIENVDLHWCVLQGLLNLECPTQMTVEAERLLCKTTKGSSLQSEGTIFCYIRLENEEANVVIHTVYTLREYFLLGKRQHLLDKSINHCRTIVFLKPCTYSSLKQAASHHLYLVQLLSK